MSDNKSQLFEKLVIEHMESLYDRAIRLTKSADAAETLVQQTYALAFNDFDRFDKNSDFNKWQIEILMLIYMDNLNYLHESASN